MANGITKEKICIPVMEYSRLKKIDEKFSDFWTYFKNLMDIHESREEVKQKKTIPQEKLFKQLGF
jgi:adenylate cyclase class IV